MTERQSSNDLCRCKLCSIVRTSATAQLIFMWQTEDSHGHDENKFRSIRDQQTDR